nr:FixH family protein [Paracoccus isoporae]
MLGLVLSLFGVVIAANLTMAVTALRSFPGLEVANSYVASQQFDRARAAQQALGWQVAPVYDGQALTLAIRDAQGLPAALSDLSVTIGRPTQSRDDRSLEMRGAGGVWRAEVDLPPGAWVLHVAARAPDGTDFRQRLSGFPGSMVAR